MNQKPRELPGSTGLTQFKQKDEGKALHTFHPFQDWVLIRLEFLIICLISVLIILGLFLYICQLMGREDILPKAHQDIGPILLNVAQKWQIFLIILLPLFFRPIRTILEKAKKVGPFELETKSEEAPNQQQRGS